MEKILYGIQTTGNGHVSRSREIIACLKERGYDVHVLFSGKEPRRFGDLEIFQPHRIFHGLTFQVQKGRLQMLQTLLRLRLFRFYREVSRLDAAGYDLIITDFEPITARLARRFKIPSIGIGHQYAFCHAIPMAVRFHPSLWILRRFGFCDYPVGLHWYHFNFPILPPVVPENLRSAAHIHEEKILVYLPFEIPEAVNEFLGPFDAHRFFVYGGPGSDTGGKFQNLCFRPFSRTGFLEDLAECNGVICNAGFESISEALHIGKKILAKPLKGQIEQESNALALMRLKLGDVMETLDRRHLQSWLEGPNVPPMGYPNVAEMVAEWIDQKRWHDTNRLAREAWRRTTGVGHFAFMG